MVLPLLHKSCERFASVCISSFSCQTRALSPMFLRLLDSTTVACRPRSSFFSALSLLVISRVSYRDTWMHTQWIFFIYFSYFDFTSTLNKIRFRRLVYVLEKDSISKFSNRRRRSFHRFIDRSPSANFFTVPLSPCCNLCFLPKYRLFRGRVQEVASRAWRAVFSRCCELAR